MIDSADRILNRYLDTEFSGRIEDAFRSKGIELALGQTVKACEGKDGLVNLVITDKGEIATDMVILCIGFRPNTGLLTGQVDMLPNGAIIVDQYMQTSKQDVFAAGDSCAVHYNPTGKAAYIPLATNAVRMGMLAARNLMGATTKYVGTQGTSGLKIYDLNLASTGLTEIASADENINAEAVTVTDAYRPEFMPTAETVTLKVVYDQESRSLLGAQIMSKADLTQAMNTLSVCIQHGMTIDELAFIDFFFQPHFNKPWNLLNTAGLAALPKIVDGELQHA